MHAGSSSQQQSLENEIQKLPAAAASPKLRRSLLRVASRLLPHDTQNTTCPPAPVVSGAGPLVIVCSIMRSGTHLLLDALFNNFPTLRRAPLFIDFDAYERGSHALDPIIGVTGAILKTHYPQTPLKPAYAATLAAIAARAVIFKPTRPAVQVRNSLAKWEMCMSNEEFAELERRFDNFWRPFAPNVVEFSNLLDSGRVSDFIHLVHQRTGLQPRTGRPIMPAHTRFGVYMDKALTRFLGCRVPRLNTTIGYRLTPKNLS